MSEVVKLVYKGLSESEWEAGKARCELDPDEWEYPRAPKKEFYFYDKKKEQPMGRKTKAARRRRYREEVSKEIMSGLEDVDSVRKVAGVVFEKDVPQDVDMSTLRSGAGEGFQGKDLVYEREKMRLAVKAGTLHLVEPEQPVPPAPPALAVALEPEPVVKEEKPAPKKRGRPPGPRKKKA